MAFYGKHTQEAREKMSKSHLGRKLSQETKKKIGEYNTGRYVGGLSPKALETVIVIDGREIVTESRSEMIKILSENYGISSPIHLFNKKRGIPKYLENRITYISVGDTIFYR